MQTYVALLRGINVGGNSIIKMADLKESFTELGFDEVQTYIQSGNVIFKTKDSSPRSLEKKIEKLLLEKHTITCKVVVLGKEQFKAIIDKIPKNWTQPELYKYNVIFLRSEVDSPELLKELHPKEEIETVQYAPGVLFWAAATSDLTRTTMVKLAAQPLYKQVTVRNLNTTKKIWEMMEKS